MKVHLFGSLDVLYIALSDNSPTNSDLIFLEMEENNRPQRNYLSEQACFSQCFLGEGNKEN